MTIHVDPIEAVWLGINLMAFALTFWNLREAHRDQAAVRKANGHAREIAARGDFRREALRLVMLACLTSVAIPGLTVDDGIALTPSLLALMAVPFIIFIQSAYDARERRQLLEAVARGDT